jgi:Domain of unknown function (DUF4304)
MDKILKELLKNHLSPFLKTHGFKRRGNHFYRKDGDFTITFMMPIDLEYTETGAFFSFVCGIYSDELAQLLNEEIKVFPKGYDHILNHSIQDISPPNEVRFHANRNEENDETIVIIKAEITKTLDFIANLKDLADLMDYCLEHNELVHHEDIMRYLAIKKDNVSMEKYLVKVREKLQKISDNAYSFYVQKSLKLKAEYASSVCNVSTASAN